MLLGRILLTIVALLWFASVVYRFRAHQLRSREHETKHCSPTQVEIQLVGLDVMAVCGGCGAVLVRDYNVLDYLVVKEAVEAHCK